MEEGGVGDLEGRDLEEGAPDTGGGTAAAASGAAPAAAKTDRTRAKAWQRAEVSEQYTWHTPLGRNKELPSLVWVYVITSGNL